jgi:hypoxanthine phosphoribosyltransferase
MRQYLNIPLCTITLKLYNNNDEIDLEKPLILQWISPEEMAKFEGKNILIVDTRLTLQCCVEKSWSI